MANGRVFYGLLASLIAVLLVSGMAGGQEGVEYAAGEIIVTFKPGVGQAMIERLNGIHGTAQLYKSPFAGFRRLRIPPGRTVEEMVAVFSKNPNVEYAEPNYIRHAFWAPNDEYYVLQWHLDNPVYGGINMEAAWDTATGAGVIVAVVDTGVAYEDWEEFVDNPGRGRDRSITYQLAPDLADTIFVEGYDFINNDSHANDDNAHGTHVTGTIAQSTNNGLGVAGVAFDCSIMPVKVLDRNGSGWDSDIADGIYWAADNGANVINLSLGGPEYSETLEDAVAYAHGEGVTVIAASGNDGAAQVGYPAAYDQYVIAVGATRYDETLAYYSNYGESLDLVAPGGQIYIEGTYDILDQDGDGQPDGVLQNTFNPNTKDPTDFNYWYFEGTSMAAPHVSGVAALVISHGVATTPDEVRECLEFTAEDKGDSGWDPVYGHGLVDADAALNYTFIPNDPPVADAGGPYTGTEDEPITFDGSGSSDPDEDPLTYEWDFGDGNTGTGMSPSHTYTAGGTYTVTLVVNDGKVDSDPSTTSTTTADIAERNDAPVADAGPDQTALVDEVVTFAASGSYDIDDGISAYDWDFGDGTSGTGVTTTHVYLISGIYTVKLTVTDYAGATGKDEAIATVTEPGENTMHVASIVMQIRTAGINTWAVATVTVVDGNGPVEGATVSGKWSGATSDSDSGLTGSDGKVALESNRIKRAASGTTFTFTVDDVTKEGYDPYDPDAKPSGSITVP